jgi:23S rRNA (cytosine1962-C5)-methyltransferase
MPGPACHVVRKRSRRLHPWVFSNEVERVEAEPGVGQAVGVFERGTLIGSGIYNPHSLVRIRLYSDKDEELDAGLIRARLVAAAEHRKRVLPDESDCRLVYGESDRLPGLVVDKYGGHFVVQAYSAGFDLRLATVAEVLSETFGAESVFEKNDFRLRDTEGLARREGRLAGTGDGHAVISESGLRFSVDIASGQKTGYYYDHRLTRQRARSLAQGRDVLDVFCYTGSFAVNAAAGGARSVLGIDASEAACRTGEAYARLNGVAGQCEFEVSAAFSALGRLEKQCRRFGLVCLDPPSFIKTKKEIAGGVRGYRKLNAAAMRLLSPGGVLITSSCSHHLSWQEMGEMLAGAAQDAGRSFTIVERLGQGPDHPVLLEMPESEYLRCFVLWAD